MVDPSRTEKWGLPDIHTRHVGDVRLIACRHDVIAAVRGFEGVFASSVRLSSCQYSVVTCREQLDFDVSGEFAVTGNCSTHDILRRELFAFQTQSVRMRRRRYPKHRGGRNQTKSVVHTGSPFRGTFSSGQCHPIGGMTTVH